MPETLACETGTPAICTHRAKGQHPAALFPWREHEWAQPSRGDGFSLGPRTYGATRPVWHCGLPATVRKLPGTQIGACIMELMRVSIRHHLHSVWNPRAARAIQVYRQRKKKAIGTFERHGGRVGVGLGCSQLKGGSTPPSPKYLQFCWQPERRPRPGGESRKYGGSWTSAECEFS